MSYQPQVSDILVNKLRSDVDGLVLKMACIVDRKASGTTGGAAAIGAWTTRTLNTIDYDPHGLIRGLSSNTFTLKPGKYSVRVVTTFQDTQYTMLRMYNVTKSLVAATSMTGHFDSQDHGNLEIHAHFDLVEDIAFRLEYHASHNGTDSLGRSANIADTPELYTVVEITRLDKVKP